MVRPIIIEIERKMDCKFDPKCKVMHLPKDTDVQELIGAMSSIKEDTIIETDELKIVKDKLQLQLFIKGDTAKVKTEDAPVN